MHRLPIDSITRQRILAALEERQRLNEVQAPLNSYNHTMVVVNGLQAGLPWLPLLSIYSPWGIVATTIATTALGQAGQIGLDSWKQYNRDLFTVEFLKSWKSYNGMYSKEELFQQILKKVPDELKLSLLVEGNRILMEANRENESALQDKIARLHEELHRYQNSHDDLRRQVNEQAMGNRFVQRTVASIYHVTQESRAYNQKLKHAIEGIGAYVNQRLTQQEANLSDALRNTVNQVVQNPEFVALRDALNVAAEQVKQLREGQQRQLYEDAKRQKSQAENERFRQTLNGYTQSAHLLSSIGMLSGNKNIALAGNVASIGVKMVEYYAEFCGLSTSGAGVMACAGPIAAMGMSAISLYQLFINSGRQSFEQTVIDQLKQLAEQLNQIQLSIEMGVYGLHQSIFILHKTVLESTSRVVNAIAYVRHDIGYLGHQIARLSLDVSCLALHIENNTNVQEQNTYGRLVREVMDAERDPTSTLYNNMDQNSYKKYRSRLGYIAHNIARQPHHTGALYQKFDAHTICYALDNNSSPLKRLAYLNNYLKSILHFDSGIESSDLVAPSQWIIGTSTYTIHRSRSLGTGLRFSVGDVLPIQEMWESGENDIKFLKYIANTPEIFLTLFKNYEHAENICLKQVTDSIHELLSGDAIFQRLLLRGYTIDKSIQNLVSDTELMKGFDANTYINWEMDPGTKSRINSLSNLVYHHYDNELETTIRIDLKKYKLEMLNKKIRSESENISNIYKLAAMMGLGDFTTRYTITEQSISVKTPNKFLDKLGNMFTSGYKEHNESILDKVIVETIFKPKNGSERIVQKISADLNSYDNNGNVYDTKWYLLNRIKYENIERGQTYLANNILSSSVETTSNIQEVNALVEGFLYSRITQAVESLNSNTKVAAVLEMLDAQRHLILSVAGLVNAPNANQDNSGLLTPAVVREKFSNLKSSYLTSDFIRKQIVGANEITYGEFKNDLLALVAGNANKYHPVITTIQENINDLKSLKNSIDDHELMLQAMQAIERDQLRVIISILDQHPYLLNIEAFNTTILAYALEKSRYHIMFHLLKRNDIEMTISVGGHSLEEFCRNTRNDFLNFMVNNRDQIVESLQDPLLGQKKDIFYQLLAICAEQNLDKLRSFMNDNQRVCQEIIENIPLTWQFVVKTTNVECLRYLLSLLPDTEKYLCEHPNLVYQAVINRNEINFAQVLIECGADLDLDHTLKNEAMAKDLWQQLYDHAPMLRRDYLLNQMRQRDIRAIFKSKHLNTNRPLYTMQNFSYIPLQEAALLRALRLGNFEYVLAKLEENRALFRTTNAVGDGLFMLAIETLPDDPAHQLYRKLLPIEMPIGELGWTPITVASREGKYLILDDLLDQISLNNQVAIVQEVDELQKTALYTAIAANQPMTVRVLIGAGAMERLNTVQIQAYLTQANTHPQIIEHLQQHESIRLHDKWFCALRQASNSKVEELLAEHAQKIDFTAVDIRERSCLLLALLRTDDDTYFDELIASLGKHVERGKLRDMLEAHSKSIFEKLLQSTSPFAMRHILVIDRLIKDLGAMEHLLEPVRHLLTDARNEHTHQTMHENANLASMANTTVQQCEERTHGVSHQWDNVATELQANSASAERLEQDLIELFDVIRNRQQLNNGPRNR